MASDIPEGFETSTPLGWTHTETRAPRRYVSGSLVIDRPAREVRLAGRAITLTLKEFTLLCHFHAHAGVVLSREELLRDVWNGSAGSRRRIDICVLRLRAKLAGLPELQTRRGRGYVLCAEVLVDPPRVRGVAPSDRVSSQEA